MLVPNKDTNRIEPIQVPKEKFVTQTPQGVQTTDGAYESDLHYSQVDPNEPKRSITVGPYEANAPELTDDPNKLVDQNKVNTSDPYKPKVHPNNPNHPNDPYKQNSSKGLTNANSAVSVQTEPKPITKDTSRNSIKNTGPAKNQALEHMAELNRSVEDSERYKASPTASFKEKRAEQVKSFVKK